MSGAQSARIAKVGAKAGQQLVRHVTPVSSSTPDEARRAVLEVYKKFQRLAPKFWWAYDFQDMPLPVFRELLKTQFTKNAHLTDLRIIDRQVQETYKHMESINLAYYNQDHVRNFLLRENLDPKPKDFLSKFLAGKD